MKKMFKIAAMPGSLSGLLKGQFKFLKNYYDVVAVASSGKEHILLQEREGVETRVIEIKRRIDIVQDIRSLFLLYILFRKEKPYIIHSITPKAGLLSMIAGYFANVPHRIHTFTGLVFPIQNGFMFHLLKNMDRLTCLLATKVYPEGEGVKNDLIRHNVTKKNLHVIGNGNVNGIDTGYFSRTDNLIEQGNILRKHYQIDEQTIVFCFIGRLVGDKGINELISAYERIKELTKDVRLLLVGPREESLDPLKFKTIRTIESDSSIIEAGFVDDVRPYLVASDIFVFPSYREGFPNVVMQACAMELPCIVTDINGCNEIIKDGINGVVIPSKDEELLYNAMEDLLIYKGKRLKIASVAREMIINRYEQKFFWMKLLREYKAIEEDGSSIVSNNIAIHKIIKNKP